METKRIAYGLITILIGLVLWFVPPPAGVDINGWHLLAIFIAVIVGLILRPLPQGAIVIIGVAVTALTGVLKIGDALSGFADSTVWLIFIAYMFARAFLKTKLGERIAYYFIRALGKRTLFLGYSISLTDLVLAPAMPSNTARAGGVIYPVLRSICRAYDSEPGPTAKKIGKFLIFNEYHTTLVTGAMFLTGMAANPLLAQLASQTINATVTWTSWLIGALVPGIITFLLVPPLIYLLMRPEVKVSEEAPKLAREKLKEMGPATRQEKTLVVIFLVVLALWILGDRINLGATVTALVGLALMLIFGVLGWEDVLGEKGGWDVLVWFGGLVSLAAGLNKLGVIKWIADSSKGLVAGWEWLAAFIFLAVVYYYVHYLMASLTAHVAAFFPAFAAVMVSVGAPPLFVALVLGYLTNL
ncbi:MAG: DASS family sodium-coupled anion symporter, partial [Candidatus Korarchaeum sp.]|nr:DASS family sodium-coupled anion symporter [Candidatus Korarchaeum sp.]